MSKTKRPASAGTSATVGSALVGTILWKRPDMWLPADDDHVLLATDQGDVDIGYRNGGRDGQWMWQCNDLPVSTHDPVTWWARLPAAPNNAVRGAAEPRTLDGLVGTGHE